MSASTTAPTESVDRLRLSRVSWKDYSRFLCLFAERPGHHLTYDRGELEVTGTLLGREHDRHFLCRLVHTLTEELGREVIGAGSATLRLRRLRRGLDPDECFWIANASRMAGQRRLDLRRDPVPDLVIEVSTPGSTLNRIRILARLGIPEVWHLRDSYLSFLVLQGTSYLAAGHSLSFPFLAPADLTALLQQTLQGSGENSVIATFRTWVQVQQARFE